MNVNDIKDLERLWKSRHSNPVLVADEINRFLKSNDLSPYAIAQKLHARIAEVVAYIDLSGLSPVAKDYFHSCRLPVSLAIELADKEDKIQELVLSKLCSDKPSANDLIEIFSQILFEVTLHKDAWKEQITGNQMMHISSKAKNAGVLSKNERKALFSIGNQLKTKGNISEKQRLYVNAILEKCLANDLLTETCFNPNCPTCKEIAKIVSRR